VAAVEWGGVKSKLGGAARVPAEFEVFVLDAELGGILTRVSAMCRNTAKFLRLVGPHTIESSSHGRMEN
jgi:hypothetical protein